MSTSSDATLRRWAQAWGAVMGEFNPFNPFNFFMNFCVASG